MIRQSLVRAREWIDSQTVRERALLLVGTIVVAVVLLYTFLITPLEFQRAQRIRRTTRRRICMGIPALRSIGASCSQLVVRNRRASTGSETGSSTSRACRRAQARPQVAAKGRLCVLAWKYLPVNRPLSHK